MLEALKKKLHDSKQAIIHLKLSEEDRNVRYDICKSCQYYHEPTTVCKKCGCVTAAKTYLAGSSCPINKWTAVHDSSELQ